MSTWMNKSISDSDSHCEKTNPEWRDSKRAEERGYCYKGSWKALLIDGTQVQFSFSTWHYRKILIFQAQIRIKFSISSQIRIVNFITKRIHFMLKFSSSQIRIVNFITKRIHFMLKFLQREKYPVVVCVVVWVYSFSDIIAWSLGLKHKKW